MICGYNRPYITVAIHVNECPNTKNILTINLEVLEMFRKEHHFKTWIDGEYIYGSYKESYFNIISEFIMWKILKMDYFWNYFKGTGFTKIWDLDVLLKEKEDK